MELTTNKIDYIKNEDGTYKLIASLDIYDNEESTIPKVYTLEMDNAILNEEQLKVLRNSKQFILKINDFEKGNVKISYNGKEGNGGNSSKRIT